MPGDDDTTYTETADDLDARGQAADLIRVVEADPTTSEVGYSAPEYTGRIQTMMDSGNAVPWARASGLILAMRVAMTQFTKPDANAEDITSGVLGLTSSMLLVISAAGGAVKKASWLLGPVGLLLGLAGAIIGAFGNRNSKFLDLIQRMIDDAIDRLETDLISFDLSSARNDIKTRMAHMARDLDHVDFSPDPDFTPLSVELAGVDAVGAALDALGKNCPADHADNWGNAAQIYYGLTELMVLQVMYQTQAMAYFRRVLELELDQDPDLASPAPGETRADTDGRLGDMRDTCQATIDGNLAKLAPYFNTVHKEQVGVAVAIRRLAPEQFRYIRTVLQAWGANYHAPTWNDDSAEGPRIHLSTIDYIVNGDPPHYLHVKDVDDGTRNFHSPPKDDNDRIRNFSFSLYPTDEPPEDRVYPYQSMTLKSYRYQPTGGSYLNGERFAAVKVYQSPDFLEQYGQHDTNQYWVLAHWDSPTTALAAHDDRVKTYDLAEGLTNPDVYARMVWRRVYPDELT